MSCLCGCLRGDNKPTPLDIEIELNDTNKRSSYGRKQTQTAENSQLVVPDTKKPNIKILGYQIHGDRGLNFDFVRNDQGEYIARFRARRNGEVVGHDSYPIPEAVYDNLHIIKKKRVDTIYNIVLDTGGHNLEPYFRPAALYAFDKELEEQGIQENHLPIMF